MYKILTARLPTARLLYASALAANRNAHGTQDTGMSVFQSNAWQQAWWAAWGNTPGFQPVAEGSFGTSGLYLDRYRFRGVILIRCLQFVGTNYRRLSTPRSEYNTLVSEADPAAVAALAIAQLQQLGWSEAVFRDMRARSPQVQALQKLAESSGWLWRTVAEDTAYAIETEGSFEAYLSQLGSNTRLRVYNRRKVLEAIGEVRFANAWPNQADHFFELLNEFHVKRWGRPCFNDKSLAFHREFLSLVADQGGVPELSVLSCGARPISVLYNVVFDGCVYNIQAGFEVDFHKKLAVGTLHLGYSIEDAFNRPQIKKLDLLAGEGKHENYKARLATHSEKLVSIMLVRSRFFRLLYRLKDR
jgi:CelD/BcsL family acetyltransferase involved in cellulose biosynthesis